MKSDCHLGGELVAMPDTSWPPPVGVQAGRAAEQVPKTSSLEAQWEALGGGGGGGGAGSSVPAEVIYAALHPKRFGTQHKAVTNHVFTSQHRSCSFFSSCLPFSSGIRMISSAL